MTNAPAARILFLCWLRVAPVFFLAPSSAVAVANREDDLRLTLADITSDGVNMCLRDDGCSHFVCSSSSADGNGTAAPGKSVNRTRDAGNYRVDLSCLASGDDGDAPSRVTLDVRRKGRCDQNALEAWNVIVAAADLVPCIVFISIFLYYHVYQNRPGANREKEELKSIFQSLGYDTDTILYKKVHDFIYDY